MGHRRGELAHRGEPVAPPQRLLRPRVLLAEDAVAAAQAGEAEGERHQAGRRRHRGDEPQRHPLLDPPHVVEAQAESQARGLAPREGDVARELEHGAAPHFEGSLARGGRRVRGHVAEGDPPVRVLEDGVRDLRAPRRDLLQQRLERRRLLDRGDLRRVHGDHDRAAPRALHPGRDALAAPAGRVRARHHLGLAVLEDPTKDGAATPRAPTASPAAARPSSRALGRPGPGSRPARARPAAPLLAVGAGDRGRVLARAVGPERRRCGGVALRLARLPDGGRELPLAVQVGERPRPIEQPLAELGGGEGRGRAVRAGRGGDALPQGVGLLAEEAHELGPRRAVVERDEAHERQRHRGRGQDEEGAAAGHRHVRELRPSRAGEAMREARRARRWNAPARREAGGGVPGHGVTYRQRSNAGRWLSSEARCRFVKTLRTSCGKSARPRYGV